MTINKIIVKNGGGGIIHDRSTNQIAYIFFYSHWILKFELNLKSREDDY